MFRPLSEAFIRRSWYSVLPVLDATERRRVKKVVVCVAQLVAALITVHGLLSFLSDVYGLFDPSGESQLYLKAIVHISVFQCSPPSVLWSPPCSTSLAL